MRLSQVQQCASPLEQGERPIEAATFSFNLPPPLHASVKECEELAQRFVDLLVEKDSQFKPCVSFGQDNGLIYCTVPATSTQGAIKAEDKALQAVGGVQLVRLSFSPTMDVEAAQAHMQASVESLYARTESVTPPAAPPAVAETAAE